MSDFFFACAEEDLEILHQLVPALQAEGLAIVYDGDPERGPTTPAELAQAQEGARATVLWLSARSAGSAALRDAADRAVQLASGRHSIVIVSLDGRDHRYSELQKYPLIELTQGARSYLAELLAPDAPGRDPAAPILGSDEDAIEEIKDQLTTLVPTIIGRQRRRTHSVPVIALPLAIEPPPLAREVPAPPPAEPEPRPQPAQLVGEDLHGKDLRSLNLVDADLTEANLTDADLNGVDLTGAKLDGANLTGATLNGANLTGATLNGANLTGAELNGANLTGAELNGAHLTDAKLNGAHLTDAELTGADLTGAELNRADLTGADLTSADLSDGRCDEATMAGVTLAGAELFATSLLGVRGLSPETLEAAPRRFGCAVDGMKVTPVIALDASPVFCVTWSPRDATGGWWLASGHVDGSVRLWDPRHGRMTLVVGAHSQRVSSVAWNPDGSEIAACSLDGRLKVWKVLRGAERPDRELKPAIRAGRPRVLAPISSVAWSPDGGFIASGAADAKVRIWDALHGGDPQEIDVARAPRCVTWCPDGTLTVAVKDQIRRWDPVEGLERPSLTVDGERDGAVTHIAWSDDGTRLAAGTERGAVHVWSFHADGEDHQDFKGNGGSVDSVAWAPDGTLVYAGADAVLHQRSLAKSDVSYLEGHTRQIRTVACSPVGATVASGSDDATARLWSTADKRQVRRLGGPHQRVVSVAWDPVSDRLAACARDSMVRIWSPREDKDKALVDAFRVSADCAAWSHDGSQFATGEEGAVTFRIDGEEPRRRVGHDGPVHAIAWHPRGPMIASASADGPVIVWDVGGPEASRQTLRHPRSISSIAWSSDGELLATAGAGGHVYLWHRSQGFASAQALHDQGGSVSCVAWSPDGKLLASCADDGTVLLWSRETNLVAETRSFPDRVFSVAWSKDGTLACGCADGTIRLCRPGHAEDTALRGHEGAITSVAWDRRGQVLASASYDGTIRFWSPSTATYLAALHAGDTGWVAFRPDGRYAVHGVVKDTFWHVIGLHRYDVGELDALKPYLRLPPSTPIVDLSSVSGRVRSPR